MGIRMTVIALAVLPVALMSCGPKTSTSPATQQAKPDNSRVSVDWAGTYQGVVPCADCEGIETSITLERDSTYQLRTRSLGKADSVFEKRGAFAWNAAGSEIQLQGLPAGSNRYLVGENVLTQLDRDGNRITGELAAKYFLPKIAGPVAGAPEALSSPDLWQLREIAGRPVPAPAAGAKVPSLVFDREGNRVHGFAGCNSFTGGCEFPAAGRLRFSMMAATRMACPDMTVEDEFLRALGTADSYSTDGKVLKLLRAKLAPLAVFEASGTKRE